jgi:hypothetical protein
MTQNFHPLRKNRQDSSVCIAVFHWSCNGANAPIADHAPFIMLKSNVFHTLSRLCGKSLIARRYDEATREPSHRSLTTEYSFLTSKLWVSFPGCAVWAALPSGMGSKMGSFQWKFVEYKGQNGFVFIIFPGAGPAKTQAVPD